MMASAPDTGQILVLIFTPMVPFLVIVLLISLQYSQVQKARRAGVDPMARSWTIESTLPPDQGLQLVVAALTAEGANEVMVDTDTQKVTAVSRLTWNTAKKAVSGQVEPRDEGSLLSLSATMRSDGFVDLGDARRALSRIVRRIQALNHNAVVSEHYLGKDRPGVSAAR